MGKRRTTMSEFNPFKIENYSDDDRIDFYAIIDTQAFIEGTLDEHGYNKEYAESDFNEITDFLESKDLKECGGFWTGNNENSLSSDIDITTYVPKDRIHNDWIYDSELILVIDDTMYEPNGSSETGWLDWVCGWSFCDIFDEQGNDIPNSEAWKYDEEFQQGYSSNPCYHLNEATKQVLAEESDHLVLLLKNGYTVKAYPHHYSL
jgi:hypothetical protein